MWEKRSLTMLRKVVHVVTTVLLRGNCLQTSRDDIHCGSEISVFVTDVMRCTEKSFLNVITVSIERLCR
jgi:hypothetical protein